MKRIAIALGLGMLFGCQGSDPAKTAGEPPPAAPFPLMRPTANDPTPAALPRYDANQDGFLDPQERAVARDHARAALGPEADELLERWDVDGNGDLDAFEVESLRRDQKLRQAKAHVVALQRYDRNGNGLIDPDERQEMRRTNAAFVQRIRAQVLQAYDANRDGVLDAQEKARLSEASRAQKLKALEKEKAQGTWPAR